MNKVKKAIVHNSFAENSPLFATSIETFLAKKKAATIANALTRRVVCDQRALARAHIRIADKREDHHYQLAHDICNQYQAIMFEDLNIAAMKKRWGRKVSDLGFAHFLEIMQQVAFNPQGCPADKRGLIFGQCERFEITTARCSRCRYKQAIDLKERTWHCEECHLILDRDHNAAINILYAGASACGLEVRQTPSGAALFVRRTTLRVEARSPCL